MRYYHIGNSYNPDFLDDEHGRKIAVSRRSAIKSLEAVIQKGNDKMIIFSGTKNIKKKRNCKSK
ncbi:MAG: hypothetical protein LBB44_02580 [Endomicrobium sp.]|jgi:hypothetical protein|nr:hypothetical protein [Endomicrobium sp.]